MSSLNLVMLIGNVGRSPETRQLSNGGSVTKFPLAINRSRLDENGIKVEETDWLNIVCFGKTSDIASRHISIGDKIHVEGEIRPKTYFDDNNQKKTYTEIQARHFVFLTPKNKEEVKREERASMGIFDDSDFPF